MRCPVCGDDVAIEGQAFVEIGEWNDECQHYDEEFSGDIHSCKQGHSMILIAP